MEREKFEKMLEEKSTIEKLPEKEQEEVSRDLICGILDDEIKRLNSPEISKILNKVIDKEDATESLINTIQAFNEKFTGQEISVRPGNSVEDVLSCTSMCLFAFIERINKRGIEERYEKVIKEDFYSINEYLNLLMNHSEFEKAELGGKFGFLKELMTDEELDEIMTQKSGYVKRCKEILEGSTDSQSL